MYEESASAIIPSTIWESMNSFFTPTLLFLILNLIIATIAFTSSLANQKHSLNNAKPPSLLQRIKSTNFYTTHYRSQEPYNSSLHQKPNPDSETLFSSEISSHSHYFFHENSTQSQAHYEQTHQNNPPETQTHFASEQKDSSLDGFQQSHEEKIEENQQSLDEPDSGDIPAKLPRMRKSASLKSPFGYFEEGDMVEVRRPATVREKGNAKVTQGDEEVDAKADDFINRFKQQLKLQRLDSIIRYKDMIGRGSGGR